MPINLSEYVKSQFGGVGTQMPDDITFVGGTASKADGDTIAHGLSAEPTIFGVTSTVSSHIVSATADATNLTIALTTHAGAAVAVAEDVVWFARL